MMFSTALHVFENEFLDYCKSELPFSKLMFGNMDYDFELVFENKKWSLQVFEVYLDHYGKPYRNDLNSWSYDVTIYFS